MRLSSLLVQSVQRVSCYWLQSSAVSLDSATVPRCFDINNIINCRQDRLIVAGLTQSATFRCYSDLQPDTSHNLDTAAQPEKNKSLAELYLYGLKCPKLLFTIAEKTESKTSLVVCHVPKMPNIGAKILEDLQTIYVHYPCYERKYPPTLSLRPWALKGNTEHHPLANYHFPLIAILNNYWSKLYSSYSRLCIYCPACFIARNMQFNLLPLAFLITGKNRKKYFLLKIF